MWGRGDSLPPQYLSIEINMIASEFSNQFDILWNNIASNQSAGLNEYEKSVFLTKAQNEIIKNYFNPKSNTKQEGFDATAKRQADFSMLIKTDRQTILNSSKEGLPTTASSIPEDSKFDPRSFRIIFPEDLFIVINEQVSNEDFTKLRQVIALTLEEYARLMSKPYKEPLKFQAWRLITGNTMPTSQKYYTPHAELILNTKDRKAAEEGTTAEGQDKPWYYSVRYIKKPMPIILEDFSEAYGEDISIDGYNGSEDFYTTRCCELSSSLHEEILQRAVELAKIAWGGDANQVSAMLQAGQRSE